MPRHTDTIAALATPVGTSALAVIRVSGSDTQALLNALWGDVPPPRELRRGDYRDATGKLVDDVLYVFFRGPSSYTGEDSLEISCHGNPMIAQKIVEDLLARGARTPEPGEFTRRAFLNGRMDLSQAEAVMDLIQARGERALEAANQQLRGSLSRRMAELTKLLTRVVAELEAYIDFPEEDLPPEDRSRLKDEIDRIMLMTNELKATARYGELLRNGIRTVIVGAPNVGKSSLLNRLVGHERALVSAEPGTTRDYIEELIMVGPYCLRLIDTAGLNATAGALERLGMAKAWERLAEADLILLVTDARDSGGAVPEKLQKLGDNQSIIHVANKIDLVRSPAGVSLPRTDGVIEVSAMTGEGVDSLRTAIVRKVESLRVSLDDASVAINARHSHALAEALDLLQLGRSKLGECLPIELITIDMRNVIAEFEEIGGKIDNERILDELFRRFCIGK